MPNLPPYLGEFADDDVRWFLENGQRQQVRAGDLVITEGVIPEYLYVVLEGEFVVSSKSLRDPLMERIGPGELLGEMSYLHRVPPGAWVHAATDGLLLAVSRADVEAKEHADPEFGSRFRKVIADFAFTRLWNYHRRRVAGEEPGKPPPGDLRVHELIEKLLRGEF